MKCTPDSSKNLGHVDCLFVLSQKCQYYEPFENYLFDGISFLSQLFVLLDIYFSLGVWSDRIPFLFFQRTAID